MPIYFDGGFGVVDVEDVATGAVLAMDKGASGERYILSGENMTVKQLFDLVAEAAGVPPRRGTSRWSCCAPSRPGSRPSAGSTGWRPLLDRNQVDEFAGHYGYLDPGKAERELGFTWRNARDTIRRTVAWAIDRGFVADARRASLRPDPSLPAY